jgi:hypothetical protein
VFGGIICEACLHGGKKAILIGGRKLREVFTLRLLRRCVCSGYTESVDLAWGILGEYCRSKACDRIPPMGGAAGWA